MPNKKKILVIDDEAPIRRVIELKLKNKGYDVITAGDGEEGLKFIKSEKPDVVITDINMPKLNGKDLCHLIDNLKTLRPFLTIIITARISLDDKVWADKMKTTVFMEKPFSPSRILDSIDQYFEEQDKHGVKGI